MEVNLKSKEVLDYKVNGSNFITKELPKKIINYDKKGVSLWTYGTGHGKTFGIIFKAIQECIDSKFVIIFTEGKDKVRELSKEIKLQSSNMGYSFNIVEYYKDSPDENRVKAMDEKSFEEISIFICHYTYLGMLWNNPINCESYNIIKKLEDDKRQSIVLMDEMHLCIDELKYTMNLSTTYTLGTSPWTANLLYPDNSNEYTYTTKSSFDSLKIIYPLYKLTNDQSYKEFVRDKTIYEKYLEQGVIFDISNYFNITDGVLQGNDKTKCEMKYQVTTFKSPGEFNFKKYSDENEFSNCVYGDLLYSKMRTLFDASSGLSIRESIESDDEYKRSYFPGLKVLQGWYTRSLEVLLGKNQCMLFSADVTLDEEFLKTLSYKQLKSFNVYSPDTNSEVYTCSKLNVYFVSGGECWNQINILDNMLGLEEQVPFRFISRTIYEHELITSNDKIKRHSFLDDVASLKGGNKYKSKLRQGETLDISSLPQLTYAGSQENVGVNYERFDWTFVWELPIKGIFVTETEKLRQKIMTENIRQCLGRMMRNEGNEKNVVFFIESENEYKDLQRLLPELVSVREEIAFKYVKYSKDIGRKLITHSLEEKDVSDRTFLKKTSKDKQDEKIKRYCQKMLEDSQYRKPNRIKMNWKNKEDLQKVCQFWLDNINESHLGKKFEGSRCKILEMIK